MNTSKLRTQCREYQKANLSVRISHLNEGITLCHVSKRRERTPDWLKLPDSNAIRIFRNRVIFEMRKFPLKRFRNSVFTRNTRTMIIASHVCLLQRAVSTIRASRTVLARTNRHLISSKAFPLSANGSMMKSGLLTNNYCKRFTHITKTNLFYANTSTPTSYPL